MSEWKKYKLKDLISNVIDNRGKTPPLSNNGGIELIETNAINGEHKHPDFSKISKFVSRETYNTWFRKGHPRKGDILISTVGDIGKVVILNEDRGCIAQNLIALKVNGELLDSEYLYYFLIAKNTQNILKNLDIGSVQPSLKVPHLLSVDICIPNIKKQRETANILSELDKKICLNTQINQTLEQIAQATFKSWFIDFDPVRAKAAALASGQTTAQAQQAAMQAISGKNSEELHRLQTDNPTAYQQLTELAAAFPSELVEVDGVEVPRGWEVGTLANICTMQNGYAFKSNEWTGSGIPVIKIGSVKPMIVEVEGNGFVDYRNKIERSDFLLTSGDILVGLTGYVGEVGRIPKGKEAMLNQRVAKFKPKPIDDNFTYYNFIYCVTRRKEFKNYAEMNAKGSAQANISTKELLNYPIVIGDLDIHLLFENTIKDILERILNNAYENETLSCVRDALLPKLLGGDLNL